MKKLHTIGILLAFALLCSFTGLKDGRFSIKAHITGFEEDTPVLLIGTNNIILDTAYVKNNRFEFSGETNKEPQNFVLYIPLENDMKYTYIFMGNEDVTVEGTIDDFPNNLTVKGSAHHELKSNYDKRIARYDEQMNEGRNKMFEMQGQNLWNDSLQRAYIGENGLLKKNRRKQNRGRKAFYFRKPQYFLRVTGFLLQKNTLYRQRTEKSLF